jgi:hypothetical protein
MKASLLDQFNRYLAAQAAIPEKARQQMPLAITISREAGAGGTTIAGGITSVPQEEQT